MNKLLRFLSVVVFALVGTVAEATITDVLTLETTGVSSTYYSDWEETVESGVTYIGNSAGSFSSIQLRSSKSSGIVSTTPIGKIKKVTVVWNSNTSSGRKLDVYGKNTAYEATSDLYNKSAQGTKLGSIVCGTSTELEVSDDYEYIGLRSYSDAMYLISVSIEWKTAEDSDEESLSSPEISATSTYFEDKSTVTITAAEGATIYYTTDGTTPTAESTEYTAAFDVTETAMVKAIAVKDEETSNAASLVLTKINVISMTFAEAVVWCAEQDYTKSVTHDDYVRITFADAKVLYVNGTQIYVRQGDDAAMLYNFPTSDKTIAVNDILNGTYTVKLQSYKGVPEFSASANVTTAATVTVTNSEESATPISATLAKVEERQYVCNLVQFTGVRLTSDDTYYWLKSGSNNVEVFNPKISANTEGLLPTEDYKNKTYTINAIVSGVYGGEGTITVISCEQDGVVEVADPEFGIADNAYVYVGQEITIAAEEGATIYYTTDGTEPTTGSEVYADGVVVVDGITQIKAIAVNASNVSSDVAVLTVAVVPLYTISEFKALAENSIGILNLDNATIKYIYVASTPQVYVADENGVGLCLYMANFPYDDYSVGTKLTGKLAAQYAIHNGKHEANAVTSTDYDGISSAGRGSKSALSVSSVADVASEEYTEALVTVTGYIKASGSKYYIVDEYSDEATSGVQLYNSFKLSDYTVAESESESQKATVTGILTYYNGTTWEIMPTVVPTVSESTAVRLINVNTFDENAPIYNIMGQRVNKNTKGILIQNGKKFIVK